MTSTVPSGKGLPGLSVVVLAGHRSQVTAVALSPDGASIAVGGFGMSGVGSKAGGPDYLLQFVEPRTVSENTLRQGFAPVETRVVSRSEGR